MQDISLGCIFRKLFTLVCSLVSKYVVSTFYFFTIFDLYPKYFYCILCMKLFTLCFQFPTLYFFGICFFFFSPPSPLYFSLCSQLFAIYKLVLTISSPALYIALYSLLFALNSLHISLLFSLNYLPFALNSFHISLLCNLESCSLSPLLPALPCSTHLGALNIFLVFFILFQKSKI